MRDCGLAWFEEPVLRSTLTLCLLVFALTFPGRNRFIVSKLEALIGQLPEGERAQYNAIQVKEKFGGLRFYLSRGTDEMFDLTNEAESASYKVCEGCGAPGTRRTGGWIRVLCDSCESKKD